MHSVLCWGLPLGLLQGTSRKLLPAPFGHWDALSPRHQGLAVALLLPCPHLELGTLPWGALPSTPTKVPEPGAPF